MTDDMTMRERMLAGELYRDDAELGAELDRAQRLAFRINSTDPTDATTMRALFTELLGEFGDEAHIRPPFHCDYGHQIRIGARSFANFGLVILDVAADDDRRRRADRPERPAAHGDSPARARAPAGEVGGRRADHHRRQRLARRVASIVCPGVTIGDNSVVGAGSVVTRDVPADVVAVGSPAKVVREL